MKYRLAILLSVVFFSRIIGQNDSESVDYLMIDGFEAVAVDSAQEKPDEKRLSFGADVGIGYMFSSNGYSGPQYMFSPHASYKLSDRVSLIGGMSLGINQTYVSYMPGSEQYSLMPMTNLYVFGGASFSLTEKLSAYSTVYTSVFDAPQAPFSSETVSNKVYGTTVGFNYKINSYFSFGAQVRIQNSQYNNLYAPYRNPQGEYFPNWW